MTHTPYQEKVASDLEPLLLRLGRHLGPLVQSLADAPECDSRLVSAVWVEHNRDASEQVVEEIACFLADCVVLTRSPRKKGKQ